MDMLKLVLQWNNEELDEGEGFDYCVEHLVEVNYSEKTEGKIVRCHTVYEDENTGKFYLAYSLHLINGDGDKLGDGCYEVTPREVTKTIYVAVK